MPALKPQVSEHVTYAYAAGYAKDAPNARAKERNSFMSTVTLLSTCHQGNERQCRSGSVCERLSRVDLCQVKRTCPYLDETLDAKVEEDLLELPYVFLQELHHVGQRHVRR